MLGPPKHSVGGIADPVAPATLAQAAASTRGQVADCIKAPGEVYMQDPAVDFMQDQVAGCTLVRAGVFTLARAVDSMPDREAGSIADRRRLMATKVRGALASPVSRALSGRFKTVLNKVRRPKQTPKKKTRRSGRVRCCWWFCRSTCCCCSVHLVPLPRASQPTRPPGLDLGPHRRAGGVIVLQQQ